jgi:hypothetical protein
MQKILHVSFHKGTINDIQYVCDEIKDIYVEHYNPIEDKEIKDYIFSLYPNNWDLYISKEMGQHIWNLRQDYFNKFDKIIVSDNAMLSRIFINNHEFNKKLIIWIVNRFDYPHGVERIVEQEYFDYFKELIFNHNVEIVACSAAEIFYTKIYNIKIKNKPIYPIGKTSKIIEKLNKTWQGRGSDNIQYNIDSFSETFYLPTRHNEKVFNVSNLLKELQIPHYHGQYKNSEDLGKFKAIIHFPYAWTTFSFYENIQNGATYLTPSINLILNLIKNYGIGVNGYAMQNINLFSNMAHLTDHFNPSYSMFVTEFDSFKDLKYLTQLNLNKNLEERKMYTEYHTKIMINRWKEILL